MAQLQEEHLRPRGVTPWTEVITLTQQNRPQEDLLGVISLNAHGCPGQGQGTSSCIHNGAGLMVSIIRRIDPMESQPNGYQPMMAYQRGETET